MRLTCLTENTTKNPNCIAEHGLSVYIETGSKRILLDFGQTHTMVSNAGAFGVDLSAVDLAVLSHGHYDHGGGLSDFLKVNPNATVYLHQNAFGEFYNGTEKYIGLNQELQGNPRLCFVNEDTQIAKGITLRLPKENKVSPLRHGGLTQKVGEEFLPDDFSHELYLEVEEENKKILLSGCAHQGVENIMAWFTPHVFVGGMHLSHFSLEEVQAVAQALQGYGARYIIGHCTGVEQAEYLKQILKTVTYLSCGLELNL